MKNSLYLSALLYDRLNTIEETSTRCYPIIAENSTTFPFIVYTRDSLTSGTLTKDGNTEVAQVSVKIITVGYREGINIAQQVRRKLTLNKFNYTLDEDNNMIVNSRFSAAYESYEENSYIQTLVFDIEIIG